jgi:hypothetical protein
MDAIDRFDRPYVIVAPYWAEDFARENDIPFIPWNFERLNDRSMEIAQTLKDEGVNVAIPLYEETVEWAGAINSVLLDQPRLYGQALLFRDKTLGYSVFVPATPELESWREAITKQIEKLIKTFDIDFGFIHPEYFVTSDGEMYFGEVAYRPPGFNAFELMERAYGFNAYQGMVLAFDPKTTEEEIEAFFPVPVEGAKGYAGCFGVYPRRRVISELRIPEETEQHPYFDFHELQEPVEHKVTKRTAFGTHWGLVYFFGDDPHKMRDLLKHQEELDFYV